MIQHDENAGVDSDVEKIVDSNWSTAASDWLHVRTQYGHETLASSLLKLIFHILYAQNI
jgi:hypothetical protein